MCSRVQSGLHRESVGANASGFGCDREQVRWSPRTVFAMASNAAGYNVYLLAASGSEFGRCQRDNSSFAVAIAAH